MNNYNTSSNPSLGTIVPTLDPKYLPTPGIGKHAFPWLDQYVDFSRRWSPEGYSLYHIACGLWVLSTIAARRPCASFSKDHFTNLTLLLVGRSSVWAKSTTAQIAKDLIHADPAFIPFLLPDFCTPEKMISMMSARLPADWEDLSAAEKDKIRQQLVFIGQRGWYFDEFGMLFSAMTRRESTMNSFHSILRKLDDTEPTYKNATIGRGEDVVEGPYLSLLGITTPADMIKIASAGAPFWSDGFFARYLFAVPPDEVPSAARFPKGKRAIPGSLVKPLHDWNKRLGLPKLQINEGDPSITRTQTYLEIPDDVQDAIYAYREGLRDLVVNSELVDLDSNYARFHIFALRISILIASFNDYDKIKLEHFASAVEITEEFRQSLHFLYAQVSNLSTQRETKTNEDKVMNVLLKHGLQTKREIEQRTKLKTHEVEFVLAKLATDRKIVILKEGKTQRFGALAG